MRIKWSDCFVAVVVLAILGGLTLAQVAESIEFANRVRCASNLQEIGQALHHYANNGNRGKFPRTIENLDDLTPVWGTPYEGNGKLGARRGEKADPFDAKASDVVPKPNDVTAVLYLLLRTQDITSAAFVCPSSGNEPWDYGPTRSLLDWTNWPGTKALAEHLSYSVQNPYTMRQTPQRSMRWSNVLSPEHPAMADINPGVPALLKLTPQSLPGELRKGNSPNHGGDGQNVLFGDGHVEWRENPLAGVKRDNIYTFGPSGVGVKSGGDGIVGTPVETVEWEDAVLLPTAMDLGVVDADGKLTEPAKNRRNGIYADMKPPTPQEQNAVGGKLIGKYSQAQPGGQAKNLQITDKKLIVSSGPRGKVPYAYKITHAAGDRARLELNAPGMAGGFVVVTIEPDGISTRGSSAVQGKWTKSK